MSSLPFCSRLICSNRSLISWSLVESQMTGTQSPPLSLTCDWNRRVSCSTQSQILTEIQTVQCLRAENIHIYTALTLGGIVIFSCSVNSSKKFETWCLVDHISLVSLSLALNPELFPVGIKHRTTDKWVKSQGKCAKLPRDPIPQPEFVTVFECYVEVWTVSGHSILSNATFWKPPHQTT